MENYLKTVLYAYPLLKTVGEDYAEHIRNKAVLSYNSSWKTEDLAEYLAKEILRKNNLLWLRNTIDGVLGKLDERERSLIAARYFGKKKRPLHKAGEQGCSDRTYFRQQQKVGDKVGGMLVAAGVTREFFETRLEGVELIGKIHRFVDKGEGKLS